MSWRESAQWKCIQADVENYYAKHFHRRILTNYFRFAIELSAGAHVTPQEKSKYVAVLNNASASKVPPKEFQKFVRQNGGIKGCVKASKAAKSKQTGRRKPK
jgi:hypothetical protein